MSESEQFLKGTSQIKILSADDIEGMRVVCKVGELLSPSEVLKEGEILVCLICCDSFYFFYAAGTRSPGYCSHDGETGRHDGRDRPRCASGINTHTHTLRQQLIKETNINITLRA